MNTTTIAAIDFGTSKIVTLVAEHSGAQRCNIIGTGLAAYDGYLRYGWNNPGELNEKIVASIKDAEHQARCNIREVHVGVPAAFIKVYPIEVRVPIKDRDQRVTSGDVQRAYKQAEEKLGNVMGRIVHFSPSWFRVDDNDKKTLEPVGLQGSELLANITYVVADKFFTDDLEARLKELGYEAKCFYPSSVGEAMLFLPEEDRDRTALLIDVGYLCTDIMTVEGDAVNFLTTIDIGGGNITADLAIGLNLSMSDAEEKIKRRYMFGIDAPDEEFEVPGEDGQGIRMIPRQEVTDIITPRVDELAEEIQNALAQSGVRLGDWSNIYITGSGLGRNQGGKDYLASKLGRPVRDVPKRTANFNAPSYSSTLGLIELIINTIETDNIQKRGVGGVIGKFFRDLFGV